MTVREYADAVSKRVKELYGIDTEVIVSVKRNDVLMTGVKPVYTTTGTGTYNCAPVLYIDDMFTRNEDVDSAALYIAYNLNENKDNTEKVISVMLDAFKSYDVAKSMIYIVALCADPSAYTKDLAICIHMDGVVYTPMLFSDNFRATSKITRACLDNWKVSEEQVIADAERNTVDTFRIQSIESILSEVSGIDRLEINKCPTIFVISNYYRLHGAAALYFKNKLAELIDSVGMSECIIFPSSVHEIIVCPYIDSNDYVSMVSEINESVVDRQDILANTAYRFSTKERVLYNMSAVVNG